MTLRSGDKKVQIAIQQRSADTDAGGQPLDEWTTLVTVWANVKGQTGMRTIESAAAGISSAASPYSFRVSFREGLYKGMRVLKSNGDVLPVEEVRMDHQNREWTDLVCHSVMSGE